MDVGQGSGATRNEEGGREACSVRGQGASCARWDGINLDRVNLYHPKFDVQARRGHARSKRPQLAEGLVQPVLAASTALPVGVQRRCFNGREGCRARGLPSACPQLALSHRSAPVPRLRTSTQRRFQRVDEILGTSQMGAGAGDDISSDGTARPLMRWQALPRAMARACSDGHVLRSRTSRPSADGTCHASSGDLVTPAVVHPPHTAQGVSHVRRTVDAKAR